MSALLLCIAVAVLYPYCRYYIDPDATAYLTIAERYANGDWHRAVNGYWSPWSCWLTAGCVSIGLQPFLSAIVVNTIGALGYLYISLTFFKLFNLKKSLQALLGLALAVFLSYAVFKQTFDDIWECFFLLVVLRLMLRDCFSTKPLLWVFAGIAGALAYFAKAYSLPFFILNTIVTGYFVFRKSGNKAQWLKMCAVSIATLLLCSSPWIYLLYDKYHIWTIGTSGKLNMSWYLVGHPYWKDGISYLLPPPYADSVYYWEDPWIVNGITPQFWSSLKLFALQIVKAGYNGLKLVNSLNEISSFMLIIVLLAIAILLSDKVRYFFTEKSKALAVSFLLFPAGFILINYEARYIWYMLPLGMVIGALALQRVLVLAEGSRLLSNIMMLVFTLSYIVWPVWDMKTILNVGKEEYEIAQALKKYNINGNFTSCGTFGERSVPAIARVAYFSGNAYYQIPADVSDKDLEEEMRRYGIKYYFHFYNNEQDDFLLTDAQGQKLPEVPGLSIKGLKIYELPAL